MEIDPEKMEGKDFWGKSLTETIDHIVASHHRYTRVQSETLSRFSTQVAGAFGERHPELLEIDNLFTRISLDMDEHMTREENEVFAYLKQAEKARLEGKAMPNPFSSLPFVDHPISALMWEHGMEGEEWNEMRRLTKNYIPPPDADEALKSFYQGLAELDADVRQHLQLETNNLFPRAMEMGYFD